VNARPGSRAAVEALLQAGAPTPAVTAVTVPPADLTGFDTLLTEDWHEPEQGCEGEPAGVLEGTASAHDAGKLRGARPACDPGNAVVRTVSAGAVPAGMREP